MIGSKSMRKTAKSRVAKLVKKGEYLVTGGSEEHTVILQDNTFVCDCKGFPIAQMCAHVIAVMTLRGMPLDL